MEVMRVSNWRKVSVLPPVRCSECGRIYPEGSGGQDGRVEMVTDGKQTLCVICAVRNEVIPRASRR